MFTAINETYFQGEMRRLGKDIIANYVVQSLLENFRVESEYLAAVKELDSPFFGELLFGRQPLVVLSAVRGSKRFSAETRTLVIRDMLYKEALGSVVDPKASGSTGDILASLLFLNRGATAENMGSPAPAGSNIVCELVNGGYGKELCKPLVDALLGAGKSEIYVRLFTDAVASHAFQALLGSADVAWQVKQRVLVAVLRTKIAPKLATDRYGSHVLEALWAGLDVDGKERLASALVPHESELRATPQGAMMWRKFTLDRLKHSRQSWRSRQLGIESTRGIFSDIIGSEREKVASA